ncbi:DUF2530 domain-containing protein [Isoptericola jiangsuensis]|uniref:DUF2530 domain-containing protein n=1 Tax=Isoptericola jiangsuensis TaxID=548579 RepID=UPI003AAF16E9
MPSVVSLLLHPDRRRPTPEPPPSNLRRVIWFGIAAWAVALVASVIALAAGVDDAGEIVATCVAGLILGGLGLLWTSRHPESR